jgi:aspartyl-tRNA synthetase
VILPSNKNYEIALKIRNEFVIEAQGKVIERESKNLNMSTGEIEVEVSDLVILNTAETPPISIYK